jgi:transcriptional regulator GlxA family with amidase domain
MICPSIPRLALASLTFYEKTMSVSENIRAPEAPFTADVLVLDDCNMLSLAATVDPMRAANRRAGRRLYAWRFLTATGAPARLTSGLTVPGAALATATGADLLAVVAGFNLDAHATPSLLSTLRRLAPRCTRVAGIDGGPWLLARAGLLDGHAATTHWEDFDAFATRFEHVTTLHHRVVASGRFLTAGAASPALDMMLDLIRARFGAALARDVAGAFLHDPGGRPDLPQTPDSGPALARRHPIVARALDMMRSHIETPLTIAALAARLNLSPRVLELRFARALGQPPKSTYLSIRLAEAHRLALDTPLAVQEIALATGFASQSSLSRAFSRTYGHPIRALRRP